MKLREIKHERNSRIIWFRLLVLSVLFTYLLSSCTVEKRRYTSGFHVEGIGNPAKKTNNKSVNTETEVNSEDVSLVPTDSSSHVFSEDPSLNTSAINQPELAVNTPDNLDNSLASRQRSELKLTHVFTGDILFRNTFSSIPEKKQALKGRGGVHPDAFSSLICGIAAMGCLAGIFLTGATPLILFAAFLVAMVVLAFFATRLAKRAFKDMHYARDRFGGKAMAAAGMLLGVLSIVAFLGLITIVVLGIAFVNLT